MATKQKKIKPPNWSKAQQALQKVTDQLDQEEQKLRDAGCFDEGVHGHLHAAIRSGVAGVSGCLGLSEKLHDLPPPDESQQQPQKAAKAGKSNGGNGSSGEGGGEQQQPQKPQQ